MGHGAEDGAGEDGGSPQGALAQGPPTGGDLQDPEAIDADKANLATPSGSKTRDTANPPVIPRKKYVSYHLPN